MMAEKENNSRNNIKCVKDESFSSRLFMLSVRDLDWSVRNSVQCPTGYEFSGCIHFGSNGWIDVFRLFQAANTTQDVVSKTNTHRCIGLQLH